MNKSSQGSWLQTDTTGSADAKTDHRTSRLAMLIGTVEQMLKSSVKEAYLPKVRIILTSSSFPFNHKKAYGNLTGQARIHWLAGPLSPLRNLLVDDDYNIIELGNLG